MAEVRWWALPSAKPRGGATWQRLYRSVSPSEDVRGRLRSAELVRRPHGRRGAVRPHDEGRAIGTALEPCPGFAAPRVRGSGVDVGPGQRGGDDRDGGDARRWTAGPCVDDVLSAVRRAG